MFACGIEADRWFHWENAGGLEGFRGLFFMFFSFLTCPDNLLYKNA